MTRPKKEEMYRNHRITVRFTETEFSIIKTAAKQAPVKHCIPKICIVSTFKYLR
jgi:hypothetical protein